MNTRFTTVDEYIALYPASIQSLLQAIRATIRKAAPTAEEKIGYQMPGYALHGTLVYFGAWKTHIGFYPVSSGISAFTDALAGYKTFKGTIQFPFNQPLPHALIADIVRFRVEENVAAAAQKAAARAAKKRGNNTPS